MVDKPKILIVDDEPLNIDLLEQELEDLGYNTVSANSAKEALNKIDEYGSAHDFPGVVLTDIKMPEMDGLELMRQLRETDPELPIILITAFGDIPMAVQAMHDGAYDFIGKPFEPEQLRETLRRAVDMRTLVLENRSLRAELTGKTGLDATIIGNSPLMEQMREMIRALANANANVLINGETGTGKELVARCLHDTSDRAKHNFVPVNCGAIPKEMFESELFGHEAGAFTGAVKQRIGRLEFAHQGTLFLDEIESMPLELQVKLLRVLDQGKIERLGRNEPIDVDFRVVAATKINLQEAAQADDFREDLYFRLNVAEIHIPPLRDRPEDVPLLFKYFARHLAVYHNRDVPDLSRDDLNDLMSHSWPGNVRELRNVVERHVLGLGGDSKNMATIIEAGSPTFVDLADRVAAFEKSVIEQTLSEAKGNIQEVMGALGMARRTLNEKMRKYGLDRKNYV